MKKIVGILAVAAIATSLFAADVSAKARLEGSLANFDGDKFQALKLNHQKAPDYNQILNFSASGDEAGASFKFYNVSEYQTVGDAKYTIWFKPISLLKITVGTVGFDLNQEHIGWWRANQGKVDSDYAYALSLGDGAWGVDMLFAADDAFWFDGEACSTFYLKGSYGADFGKIGAAAKFESNFKNINIAAAYSGNFGGVSAFVNAGIDMADSNYTGAKVEPYAEGSVDAFNWKVYLPVSLPKDQDVALGLNAKVDYNLSNGMNANCEFEVGNFMAKQFSMMAKPGLTGRVGAMGWEAYIQLNIADKFTMDMPLVFNLDF